MQPHPFDKFLLDDKEPSPDGIGPLCSPCQEEYDYRTQKWRLYQVMGYKSGYTFWGEAEGCRRACVSGKHDYKPYPY